VPMIRKHVEPPDAARLPATETDAWRAYMFGGPPHEIRSEANLKGTMPRKEDELLVTIHLGSLSCWLIGHGEHAATTGAKAAAASKGLADIRLTHESISAQHAVIQFRRVPADSTAPEGDAEDGRLLSLRRPRTVVRPYVMDLDSEKGTRLNGHRIPARRYVELRDGDELAFGKAVERCMLQKAIITTAK